MRSEKILTVRLEGIEKTLLKKEQEVIFNNNRNYALSNQNKKQDKGRKQQSGSLFKPDIERNKNRRSQKRLTPNYRVLNSF